MSFNVAEARLKTIKKLQAQLKDLSQVNKKLKEENKELKEELEDVKEEYWEKGWNTGKCDTWDEIDKTVKPLKEEIKELKQELGEKETSLHYYACMWHVTGCDDTPTKEEIEDYLNRNMPFREDKEDVKRELWEQFGYEEEDED